MGNSNSAPLAPSVDPWYTAPVGFEQACPGEILKMREVPGLVSHVTNSSAAYQFIFRTTDSRYEPSWAATTFLVPANVSYDDPKLLSYQIPYDSAAVDASPSYTIYQGTPPFGDGDITAALGRGWFVSTPDYESYTASFTAGVISGHATLDSVRAVLSSQNPVQLSNPKYALWGYSGGALASEWAAELQNQYAPELNFVGAALGGLTPNVSSVLHTISGTIYAGLVVSGTLGLASQFPDAQAYLESQLKQDGPYNAAAFNAGKNYSLLQATGAYAGQDIGQYFINGLDTLNAPIPQRTIESDGLMGFHGVPQMPLFVYKAIADDISVVADTDKLVASYCDVGATIDYQRNTVGNHASELFNGNARAFEFLTKVFDGTYTATGCTIKDVTIGQ